MLLFIRVVSSPYAAFPHPSMEAPWHVGRDLAHRHGTLARMPAPDLVRLPVPVLYYLANTTTPRAIA